MTLKKPAGTVFTNCNGEMRRPVDGRFALQLERGVLTTRLQEDSIAFSVAFPGNAVTSYLPAAFVVTLDVTTRFAGWHSSCTEAPV